MRLQSSAADMLLRQATRERIVAEKLVIKNVGLLLSGDLTQPILDANTVVVVDGRIAAVGKEQDLDHDHADIVVDAQGTALVPGLIDSHVHPVSGGRVGCGAGGRGGA